MAEASAVVADSTAEAAVDSMAAGAEASTVVEAVTAAVVAIAKPNQLA
jgi:hypothetical protein